MGRLGLEPRTNRLKAEYSTIELATRFFSATVYKYSTAFSKREAIYSKNVALRCTNISQLSPGLR